LLSCGDNVLEVGCGTGELTFPLGEAVGGMGRCCSGRPSVGVQPAAFDVVTSRMGAMFFADPVAAFRNIGRALKPGRRLVFARWAPLAENRHWLISYDIAVRHWANCAVSRS
jgi:ubiquinone/menaquinone biosynthesis C-methylase UbiE